MIDCRVRPPAGPSLQQRLFLDETVAREVFRQRGYTLPGSIVNRSMTEFLAELDRAGIDKAIVPARAPNEAFGEIPNSFVAEIAAAFSDRFIGVGCARLDSEEAIRDIDECVGLGFVGVALEPGLAPEPLHADDAQLYPIYDRIRAAGMPVLISGADATPDISFTSPVALDRVARDFPDLNVVAVHGGWPWVTETLGVAWRRKNVWIMPDLYWVNMPGQADYTVAANGYLRDRMVLASSYPAVNIEQYLNLLRSSGLSADSWVAISQQNPRILFGLSGATH